MKYPCKYTIKILDSEYKDAGKNIKKYGELLEEAIYQYIYCLSNIAQNAVPSGKVHDAIVCFVAYLSPVQGMASDFGSKFKSCSNGYISIVDSRDSYLYEKGGKRVRDFSAKEFNNLMNMLKGDIWMDDAFEHDDWFQEKMWNIKTWIGRAARWDDVTDPKLDINECHRRLLDYNNADKTTIRDIFSGIQDADDEYTAKFNKIVKGFEKIKNYLDKAAYLIDPGRGRFTVDDITSTLGPLLADLKQYYNEVMSIHERSEKPTIGEIEDFISQPWAAIYFAGLGSIFDDFIDGLDWSDDVLSWLWTGDEKIASQVKDVSNPTQYEEDVLKGELMDMLDDMAETYRYSGSEEAQKMAECKSLFKYIKKYGTKWYSKLDKRTVLARELNDFLNKLGILSSIASYSDSFLNILSKCFIDYSLNDKILTSFLNNASASPMMKKVANDIANIYRDKLYAVMDEAAKQIANIGFKEGISYLAKNCSPIKMVTVVSDSIVITGNITGLRKQYQNLAKAMACIKICRESEKAYQAVIVKMKKTSKNSKEYSKLLEQAKHCFEMTKRSAVNAFNAMALYYDGGDARAYYEYCARTMEEAEMFAGGNAGPLKILSYEKWLAA